MPDNIGAMFYFGEVPWHGNGTKIEQPATADEALKFGGLDWEVELMPLVTEENPHSPVFRRVAVVRKDRVPGDPGRVIGVVHPGFRPLQNHEGIELLDSLLGHGKQIYHTGGYLGNGEVVWLLARLPKDIKVQGTDVVEPYMLFANSHDGSIAVDFRLTTIRVVCQNTLTLALKPKNSSLVFKRSHQGSYMALEEDAERFFKMCNDATAELDTRFQAMSSVPLDSNALESFIENLVPLPKPPARAQTSTQVRRSYEQRLARAQEIRVGIKKVFDQGIKNSITVPPANPNIWGALNAVTAYVDHVEQTGTADRYVHIIFGSGAKLKSTAYKLAASYLPPELRQAQLLE